MFGERSRRVSASVRDVLERSVASRGADWGARQWGACSGRHGNRFQTENGGGGRPLLLPVDSTDPSYAAYAKDPDPGEVPGRCPVRQPRALRDARDHGGRALGKTQVQASSPDAGRQAETNPSRRLELAAR